MISGINYNKLCELGGSLGHLSAIFDDFTMYHVWTWWTCWDMDMLIRGDSVCLFLGGVRGWRSGII